MKTRKLVSLGLATVMSLSLSAPIFAADPAPADPQTVFTSTYTAPDIKVTVPQTGSVMLNPLGLDVDLSEAKDGSDATQIIKGQQIVTMPAFIVNNSSMNLSVGAKISTKVEGTVKAKLVANEETLLGNGKAETDSDYVGAKTDKSAFMFFQMMAPTTALDTGDAEALNKAAAKWTYDYTEEHKTVDGADAIVGKEGCVVLQAGTDGSAKEVTGEDLVTLKAAKDGEVATGGVALMRIAGKMVKAPKVTSSADNSWKADDKITSTVVFTFAPAT